MLPRRTDAGPERQQWEIAPVRPRWFLARRRRESPTHPRSRSRRLAFWPVSQCLDRSRSSTLQLLQDRAHKPASKASAVSAPTSPAVFRQLSRLDWRQICLQSACARPTASTAKIETMLARILAVDPTEKLLLLLGGERPRAPRGLARTQRTQSTPFSFASLSH